MNSYKRATAANNVAHAIEVDTVDSGQYDEQPMNGDLREEVGQTYSQYTHEKSYHLDDESQLPPLGGKSANESVGDPDEARKSVEGLTTEAD